MSSRTILHALGALLLVSCAILIHADAPNPLKAITKAGKALEGVGINTLCVADMVDNSEALSQANKVYDGTVAGIKAEATGPLTVDKLGAVLRVLITDTAANLRPIDEKCAGVKSYCPTAKQSALGDLGKALQVLGATVRCLVADPKPEVLLQIPIIMSMAIENVASSQGAASTTSVGILLPEIIFVSTELQKLSPACSDVVKKC